VIQSARSSSAFVSPRVRILGLPAPWELTPEPPHRVAPDPVRPAETLSLAPENLLVERPRPVLPGRMQVADAGAVEIANFAFDPMELTESRLVFPRLPASGDPNTPGYSPLQNRARFLARRLAAVLQPPLEALLAPYGTLEWTEPLLPFQQAGVRALLFHREVLLADDMGLGKTVQTTAALRILFHRGEIRSALVVTPASLVQQWVRELRRWAPELRVVDVTGAPEVRAPRWQWPAHVRVVGYETLRQDVLGLRQSPALRRVWDVVVLDEASRIKNRESGIAVACHRLPRDRRWVVTGTPVENRVEDILSLLEFMLDGTPERVPTGPGPELRQALAQRLIRRRKADVLPDLPPKRIIDVLVELTPSQRRSYQQAEREATQSLAAAGDSVTLAHILEVIVRLKQICNADPSTGESAKLEDLERRMGTLTAQGHRALIFSQFTDPIHGVRAVVHRLSAFQPLSLTGDMNRAARNAVVDRFRDDERNRVLVLSLRAGGVGLNLQTASYVFHLDRWWNPAIEDQAEARAHRIGQNYPVTVYRYTCLDTIEERIAARLDAKRQLARDLVDDAGLDLRAALTEAELFELFGLREPRRPAGEGGTANRPDPTPRP